MSDAIFPVLIGQEWPVSKTPSYKTLVQTSVSGKEKRLALQSYPRWTFIVSYSYLSDGGSPTDDIHTLVGFYLARQGQFDTFLFNDVTDNTATNQTIATGDGSTTQFQLVRNYGGFIEPVKGLVTAPVITVNGVATTAFTWTTMGMINFSTAPPAGAVIAWTGQFLYRCRFTQDHNEFQNNLSGMWAAKQLEFITVK